MDEKDRKNILILDPERDTAELFSRALESYHSCKCYWVKTVPEAKRLLSDISFNFLLADISTLLQDRFVLLDTIRELDCNTTVIVDCYIDEKEGVGRAIEKGACGHFIKPIMVNSLRKIIDDFAVREQA